MMQTNHDRRMQQLLDQLKEEGRRPRLLLHCCCAPCSTAVMERLHEAMDITLFYCNPNIDSLAEHERRREELARFSELSGLHAGLVAVPYAPQAYREAIRGLEHTPEGGARCEACFRLRLAQAAAYAAQHGFDWFTTTLTISPMKSAALLNRLGEEAAARAGSAFLNSDFKKRGGYPRSTELSRQFRLYRQDYCGCALSRMERDRRLQQRRQDEQAPITPKPQDPQPS